MRPTLSRTTQHLGSTAFRESSSEAKQDSVLTTPASHLRAANGRPTRSQTGMLGASPRRLKVHT